MKTQINNLLLGSIQTDSAIFNVCYVLFRIYAGLSIALGAGLSKVFHKIDEKGDDSWNNMAFGASDWFINQVKEIGFTFISPSFWAYLAIYGEFLGGLLIAFGIFTRLSSIQLAFQFFVVAFIWYGEPAPMVGMYYQQLIFWSFVMTYAAGDGKYSLATLFSKMKERKQIFRLSTVTACFSIITFISQAQTGATSTEPARVSFTIANPSLKNKMVDFKSYNADNKMIAGYGYGLNALATHAVNLPSPVFVYEEKNGKKELLFVVTQKDNGKKFSVNQEYEITREQYLDAAWAEMKEKETKKSENDKSIEGIAKQKGIKLVGVNIKGASLFPSMVHVRYELPWTKDNQMGFSTSLSKTKRQYVFLPVGTKIYQCSDKYWDKSTKFTEKLLVTLDGSKNDYLVPLQ
jgi:uncharacterized membrane protein YphA (DoxX/SURF4 family)